MKKKYIVELEDNTLAYQAIIIDGTPYIKPLQLLPYTEPDLEQVRKEAYEKGFDDGRSKCQSREYCMNESYQQGLNDAWEVARKILRYGKTGGKLEVLTDVFSHADGWWDIINRYTAAEAIEKLKQYEQGQVIKVGNEVKDDKDDIGVCTEISYPANSMHILYADGTATDISLTGVTKTGRNFPQVVDLLKKMRGKEDARFRADL